MAESHSTASEFKKYIFHCSDRDNGEIYLREGDEQLWFPEKHRPLWLFAYHYQSEFTFSDTAGQKLVSIRSKQKSFLKQYTMDASGKHVGEISHRGLFLNQYSLQFDDGTNWIFELPLFSAVCRGVSNTGKEVRVRKLRRDTWQVRIDAVADSLPLMTALALIHQEQQ